MTGSGQIPEEGMWYLHQLFSEVADKLEVETEDTIYDEEAVHPKAVHKQKSDHKESIYLLSEVMAEELEEFEILETWKNFEERTPEAETKNVKYYSNSIRDEVKFENVSFDVYHNGKEAYRWNVLEDLSNGVDIKSSLRKHYEDPAKRSNQDPYHQLHRKILENGMMPEDYRNELRTILERADKIPSDNPVGK